MLISIVKRFQADGLKTLVINSNDAATYPEDESQDVARLFDAACTPEFYLFDRDGKLAYHGTINDSPRDPSRVTKDYLSKAIEAVLEGRTPEPQFVHPLGCSIKWR
jgi:hypothetical protein